MTFWHTRLQDIFMKLPSTAMNQPAKPKTATTATPRIPPAENEEATSADWDETQYLLSNPANAAHLARSLEDDRAGRTEQHDLVDD
jgi:hypothetical protein